VKLAKKSQHYADMAIPIDKFKHNLELLLDEAISALKQMEITVRNKKTNTQKFVVVFILLKKLGDF